MKPAVYLAFDVESGGVETDKSLLTVYFAALDEDWNQVDELDLKVKPNDGTYRVTAEALRINGIDIKAHDLEACEARDASTKIYDFLNKISNKGSTKLIPVGHNVHFDIDFITAHSLSKKSWDKFCSYRRLDTGGVSMFLIAAGVLPSMKASLGSLAEYFGIKFEAHTARGDTLATVEVMKNLIKLAKK